MSEEPWTPSLVGPSLSLLGCSFLLPDKVPDRHIWTFQGPSDLLMPGCPSREKGCRALPVRNNLTTGYEKRSEDKVHKPHGQKSSEL